MSALTGSDRTPLDNATPIGPVPDDELALVTVVCRRPTGQPAEPADLDAVTAGLPAGVDVVRSHAPSGRVQLIGPANALAEHFGTTLTQVWRQDDGRHYRHRTGALSVPDALDGTVVAVLGLDDRPAARPHFYFAQEPAASYTPLEVAQAYAFPAGLDGTGQRIALVELGGGYADSDLDTYWSELGVTGPTVTDHEVDGATNAAGSDPEGADGEVLLDIEVAGAVAPGAGIDVWFGPNTDAGFLDAVSDAIHADPRPTVVSISWGGAEDSWTAQARSALDAALADAATLGVTVTVAAGDSGSSDNEPPGAHVDFPASSPHALACGGTTLRIGPDGAIETETVWNDGDDRQTGVLRATGGGYSAAFARPDWQSALTGESTGRGVPDVVADADPDTGYIVRVDGESTVIGGTSAVAPLWAGLIARLAQGLDRPLGLLQPALYGLAGGGNATTPALHDVTTGDNGQFQAGPGWDPCTGLGSPNGTALLEALRSPTGSG
jgi:kumamolisin